jgi:sulfopropanediol 3-dehydrogenase
VGSYSPGGLYPLIASSLMTIITPKAAGVDRVVAVAPPRDAVGIHPPQLYAMTRAGADEIFCIGGVQALAALAVGIEGSEPVDMIVGAGNAYVAEAKRQLFGEVGIDLLAGPTEIAVIADEHADARLVAADLLGQAEHGPTSPAILITTSRDFGESVIGEVERWLSGDWPTVAIAGKAWHDYGAVVVCESDDEAVQVSDDYAAEHLEIQTRDPGWYQERLRNYGSLFLGPHSTVAFSDKSIGTNHVLPTRRAARYTGGLWVGKFLKTLTYQSVTSSGSEAVAPSTAAIADAELMFGHALTARLRLRLPDWSGEMPPSRRQAR